MEQALPTPLEKRRLKKEITRLVKKWIKILDLEGFQIRVSWGPALPPDDKRMSEDAVGSPYASCESLHEYRAARLYFDPSAIPPHEDLEQLVVHELVHVLLGPLQDAVQDFVDVVPGDFKAVVEPNVERAVERTCTSIATVLVKALAGKAYGTLHFDQKETANGHPQSAVGSGTAPGRKPRRRSTGVRRNGRSPKGRGRTPEVSLGGD